MCAEHLAHDVAFQLHTKFLIFIDQGGLGAGLLAEPFECEARLLIGTQHFIKQRSPICG